MLKMIVAAVALLASGATIASDQTDAVAMVQKFTDGFNKGDTKEVAAACADDASIIDEFPPYAWSGQGACLQWMKDWDSDAQKKQITEPGVTLGKPRHVDVTGDRAYVVVPANYHFKQGGKPVKEDGAMFTLVLRKYDAGWRVIAWAWPKP